MGFKTTVRTNKFVAAVSNLATSRQLRHAIAAEYPAFLQHPYALYLPSRCLPLQNEEKLVSANVSNNCTIEARPLRRGGTSQRTSILRALSIE